MAFCTTMLLAQSITVKGTVVGSEDGLPIIGAYVMEKGTKNGTSTDVDGNFVITVEDLVRNGYYVADDSDGNVVDPRNSKNNLNGLKIKLTYSNGKINADVIEEE